MAFTFFFRDQHTLDLIEEHVLPQLRTRRYLDIWDAGCATGEEPFTLAILLRENMGQFQFRNVRICATDLNGSFGDLINKASYSDEQVKRIPEEVLKKYFVPAGDSGRYTLDESIKQSVSFKEHDLTTLQTVKKDFGLIVCKNVLLHLSLQQRVDVLRMFHDSLVEGGFLATESTQKMPVEAQKWFRPVASDGPVFQRIN